MTQEDKDLLLQDLCVKLPYGIKVQHEDNVFDVDYISPMYEEIKLDIPDNYTLGISEVKPYLFPLSSMTEEQEEEYNTMYEENRYSWRENIIDWFHKNHLDYRGLIPKGLAIDATGKNIY